MLEDFDLVISSFQTQYGIRLSRELRGMKWNEFRDLLVGLGPETPLGRIVAVRSEEDKEILKYFSKEQHRIRNQWRSKRAGKVSEGELQNALDSFKNMFIAMAGGKNN